ncbi:hypothetical protein EJ08DRAFT_491949 [Tothia fuscella]|uniref:Reverse transcriptase n=1 Tax=Tothia fuscella TaxID=1048955 RepID=A0A9P4TU14_9PEZI|nr:hypothetical protein EJ08DRAFT_491949 [Tothia fuscella]
MSMTRVYLLSVSDSRETDCRILAEAYKECTSWGEENDVKFDPSKCGFIHFTRTTSPCTKIPRSPKVTRKSCKIPGPTKAMRKSSQLPKPREVTSKPFKCNCVPNIPGFTKPAAESLRVLGVTLVSKLRWKPHIATIQFACTKLRGALAKIIKSTHGPRLAQARQLYLSMCRSKIVYGATAWYRDMTIDHPNGNSRLQQELEVMQNKFLRLISSALISTAVQILQKELYVEPMLMHLERIVLTSCAKQLDTEVWKTIHERFESIVTEYDDSYHPSSEGKPNHRFEGHTARLEKYGRLVLKEARRQEPGFESMTYKQKGKHISNIVKFVIDECMQERWSSYRDEYIASGKTCPPAALDGGWGRGNLHIHGRSMKKMNSTMLLQLRTGVMPLNYHRFKLKQIVFPSCTCGAAKQTVLHLLTGCPNFAAARAALIRKTGTICQTTYR